MPEQQISHRIAFEVFRYKIDHWEYVTYFMTQPKAEEFIKERDKYVIERVETIRTRLGV